MKLVAIQRFNCGFFVLNRLIELTYQVLEAMVERARFLTRTGQWTEAFVGYDAVLARPKISTGKKMDALMEKARVSFFNLVYA